MPILVNKYLIRSRFTGIALWPFIFVRESRLKNNLIFINHEKIHLRQQAQLLVIPFYLWYVIEYYIKLLKYKDSYIAYRNISFEREAYHNERDLLYLKKRRFWAFLKYLKVDS